MRVRRFTHFADSIHLPTSAIAALERLRAGNARFVADIRSNATVERRSHREGHAAGKFGTKLVVVLGHSRCGAIEATVDELQRPSANQSRNLSSIVDRVRPSVEALLATGLHNDREALLRDGVRANVRVSASQLRHGSELLESLIARKELLVVGAEYSIESGVVDFFDGVPEVANRETSR